MKRIDGTEWLAEQDAASSADFRRFVRLYAAAGEPFPAAAAVWRDLSRYELTALAALATGKTVPFNSDWLQLNAQMRERALIGMRRVIALGAMCAEALELESQLRRDPRQRELFT